MVLLLALSTRVRHILHKLRDIFLICVAEITH